MKENIQKRCECLFRVWKTFKIFRNVASVSFEFGRLLNGKEDLGESRTVSESFVSFRVKFGSLWLLSVTFYESIRFITVL